MNLNVDDLTIALARCLCDQAVNMPFVKSLAAARGAKVAISKLYGRRVISDARGVLCDRPISLAACRGVTKTKRRRTSNRSGRSNWPGGTNEERMAELRRRAIAREAREEQKRLEELQKAVNEMAKALDSGEGPYRIASEAQRQALLRLREQAASLMAISADRLSPSAAAVVTLVAPTSVPSHVDGVFVNLAEDSVAGVPSGMARCVRRGSDSIEFMYPGAWMGPSSAPQSGRATCE